MTRWLRLVRCTIRIALDKREDLARIDDELNARKGFAKLVLYPNYLASCLRTCIHSVFTGRNDVLNLR